jgi:GNAT superfamily N-acetyltransferase
MQTRQRLEFETADRKELYEYIERTGTVTREELAEEFWMDDDQLDEELAALEAEGYIEEREERLGIGIDVGTETEFETDEFTYTIRPAEQDDLTGIIATMRSVAEERDYFIAETAVDLVDHEQLIFRNNDIRSRVFFVATVDDEVVGWVHLESPNYEKLSHTAELTMGVREEYRGHGIGSHLMERGLDWARSQGYEKVYQSLPATNQEAVRFLEEHRWETEALRQAHYKIEGEYAAEQMMAVMLEQPGDEGSKPA